MVPVAMMILFMFSRCLMVMRSSRWNALRATIGSEADNRAVVAALAAFLEGDAA